MTKKLKEQDTSGITPEQIEHNAVLAWLFSKLTFIAQDGDLTTYEHENGKEFVFNKENRLKRIITK